MSLSLYAINEGHLDDVDVKKIVDCEHALHAHLRANAPALKKQIDESGDWNADIEAGLKKCVTEFKQGWVG
jgi:F-type H+-transporting ATPase subunit alpha